MSKLPVILTTSILALTFFTGCSSPASSNPVSEDGFVTISDGTYTVDCDEHGNGCREVTVETFEISQNPVSYAEWMECVADEVCNEPRYPSSSPEESMLGASVGEIEHFISWRSENEKYQYRLATLEIIQSYLPLVEPSKLKFWTSSCRVDSAFVRPNKQLISTFAIPESFTGFINPTTGQACNEETCLSCALVWNAGEGTRLEYQYRESIFRDTGFFLTR